MLMPRPSAPQTAPTSTPVPAQPAPRSEPALPSRAADQPAVRLTQRAPAPAPRGLLGRLADWGAGMVNATIEVVRDHVWALLEEHAPSLVPILRMGVVEWLKEKVGEAFRALMDILARPVRSVGDLIANLRQHFGRLMTWLREAASKIARNDCSSITEAAGYIQQAFEGFTGPIIERIKHYVEVVKGFFDGLWQRFGAPVWQWLQEVGGAIWEQIQRIGRWIWEKTAPVRDLAARAWRWFKNLLGIGEGQEGQNGILQWFQQKASQAWEWVSARLEPYKRKILIAVAIVGGIILWLSPAGPLLVAFVAGAAILRGIQWIRQNLSRRDGVVQQQLTLRTVILPPVMNTLERVIGIVQTGVGTINDMLSRMMNALNEMRAAVLGIPLISLAAALIGFIVDRFRGMLEWAQEGVAGLGNWLQSGLRRLGGFVRRVISFLEEIAAVAQNILRNFARLAGRIWNLVPACLRDPFIDWFIPLILRRVPFFSELASSPEAWRETRTQITTLVRQVFQDFDLFGAMRTAFTIVLRVLRLPIELLLQLLDKASLAFDAVVAAPLRFIENAIRSILRGIGYFFVNILDHLQFGITTWLFNAVSEAGITPPTGLSFPAVFRFVMDVLGLSMTHVLDVLVRNNKISQQIANAIRTAVRVVSTVMDWLGTALTQGPRGLWDRLTGFLGGLATSIIESAIGWVMGRVVANLSARLTAAAASAGLTGVLEAVKFAWAAFTTFTQYLPRIVQALVTVFDTIHQIATGNLEPGARGVERGMRLSLPIVLNFLAEYVGFGGISRRIREIIGDVRERVDRGILWLWDRAAGAVRSLLNLFNRSGPATAELGSANFGEGVDRHRVYVVSENNRIRTMINPPPPTPLIAAIDTIDARIVAEIPVAAGRAQAQNLATSVRTAAVAFEASPTVPATGTQAYANQQAALLGPLYSLVGHPSVPPTVITPNPVSSGGGGVVEAKPLTRTAPTGKIGQSTTNSPIPSDTDMSALNKVRDQWVKMHLLSFRLHGPDQSWNFTPGTKSANAAMEQIERETRNALSQNEGRNVWHYRTRVVYRTVTKPPPSPDETKFPQLVIMTRGPYDPVANRPLSGTRTTEIESPSPTLGAASLSSASVNDMVGKGVDRSFAETIFDGRTLIGRPYQNANQIIRVIEHTARFNAERLVGGVPQYLRMAQTLDTLAASGQIVYNNQE